MQAIDHINTLADYRGRADTPLCRGALAKPEAVFQCHWRASCRSPCTTLNSRLPAMRKGGD